MILYYLFRKEKSPTIGEKVGMLNVSSFIRNFKQQTGLTPGQYRSLHTANKAGFEGMQWVTSVLRCKVDNVFT